MKQVERQRGQDRDTVTVLKGRGSQLEEKNTQINVQR